MFAMLILLSRSQGLSDGSRVMMAYLQVVSILPAGIPMSTSFLSAKALLFSSCWQERVQYGEP